MGEQSDYLTPEGESPYKAWLEGLPDRLARVRIVSRVLPLLARLATKEPTMNRPDRPHDETVIELMRDDPAFAQELLEACLESVDEPGGRGALLSTLRCYAEAKGMSTIAQQTGLSRESLYRSLSPSSNPTLSNLSAVFAAIQCELGVKVQVMVA